MASPWAIVGAVTGAVGVISSLIGSKKSSDAAKKQSREEARLEKIVTDERLRQIDIEERALYGETLAGYAGGGVQAMTPGMRSRGATVGSPATILAEQKTAFQFEKKVTKEAGASRAQQALTGGKMTADLYKYQGYSQAASGISDIIASQFWKS